MPDASPLDALVTDLYDLLAEDERDEYGILRPTVHAFTTMVRLIMGVSMVMDTTWPFAAVSTDSEGGIRITWVKGRHHLRLLVPASCTTAPSLYYACGDKSGILVLRAA